MRWWQSLRQAYPTRSALTLAVAVLFVCLIVGGGLTVGGIVGAHMTSTESFCINCHELRDNAYAEYKGTIHASNRTGVRATCPDCHVPRAVVPLIIRKVKSAREVWNHLAGEIDTKEKYEKNRHRMAVLEWTRMKESNSRECRHCHDIGAMKPEKQSEAARAIHPTVKEQGIDCVDCHFGIAHKAPEGPGPSEIKVSR